MSSHGLSFVRRERASTVFGVSSSSYKDTSPIELEELHPYDHINLNYLPKGPISTFSHVEA